MSSGVTDYGANAIADHLTGVASLPGTFYVAMCSAQPDTSVTGTTLAALEPGAPTGYVRQPLTRTSAAWAAAILGQSLTIVGLTFPTASNDWGLVSHYALCDAVTAGNVFAFGELALYQFVAAGEQFSLPAGAINLALGSPQSVVVV